MVVLGLFVDAERAAVAPATAEIVPEYLVVLSGV
jgi:hypothetical protein